MIGKNLAKKPVLAKTFAPKDPATKLPTPTAAILSMVYSQRVYSHQRK